MEATTALVVLKRYTRIKPLIPTFFNILKEPLIVQKQTIPQQKALDLSFNLVPRKWAWRYQEGATPSRREKQRCAWGIKSYFGVGGRGSLFFKMSNLGLDQGRHWRGARAQAR